METTPRTRSPNLVTARDITAAPVDPASAHLVQHLVAQVLEQYAGQAALNVTTYNAALYDVADDQAVVSVGFRDEQGKGYLPGIFAPGGACSAVAIPAGARPAAGTDAHLGVFYRDTLVELWRARRGTDGSWSAVWGGRIPAVSTTTGQYPGGTGVSASGLMMPAFVLGIDEVRAGRIDHAVGIGITRVAAGPYSWPAVRTDGTSTAPDAIHMGRVFRLPADVDLDAIRWPDWAGKLTRRLHPVAKLIGEAAKRYGLVVVETAGCVGVSVESGAPTKAVTGVDPWAQLLGSTKSYDVLGGFPWDRLQALPFNDGKPAAATTTTARSPS